jgi:hypothetical protein
LRISFGPDGRSRSVAPANEEPPYAAPQPDLAAERRFGKRVTEVRYFAASAIRGAVEGLQDRGTLLSVMGEPFEVTNDQECPDRNVRCDRYEYRFVFPWASKEADFPYRSRVRLWVWVDADKIVIAHMR